VASESESAQLGVNAERLGSEERAMGLDNVAVQWPRTGRFYEPVDAAEFTDFIKFAEAAPAHAGPAAALATHIARAATVRASAYTDLVDLLLGLEGVLYATDAAAEDEDPVIDPDGCAWIAGGLERFVASHAAYGDTVTFDTIAKVMRQTLAEARLANHELRWLDTRLDALRDEHGHFPQWGFSLLELDVLAHFYRRCTDRGFAVYADS
jgi:hypothetical protein